jgi:hypothetical protein
MARSRIMARPEAHCRCHPGADLATTPCRNRTFPPNSRWTAKLDRHCFLILGLVAWQWHMSRPTAEDARSELDGRSAADARGQSRGESRGGIYPLREEPVIAARSQSLYSKTAEYVFSNDKGGSSAPTCCCI